MQQKLVNVYTTLNQIEVKGEKNIEYMYGCIMTLKDAIVELENQTKRAGGGGSTKPTHPTEEKENNKNKPK